MLGVNRLLVHMREVAPQPGHFLCQPNFCGGHQLPIALIPQFVAVSDCPGNTAAARLDGVFRHEIGLERGQLPMPVDDLPVLPVAGDGVHVDTVNVDGSCSVARVTR